MDFADHYPFLTLPVLPPPMPSRFVKRGSSMICTTCDLDVRYCKGHAGPPMDVGSQDGASESDLERRARECKATR